MVCIIIVSKDQHDSAAIDVRDVSMLTLALAALYL